MLFGIEEELDIEVVGNCIGICMFIRGCWLREVWVDSKLKESLKNPELIDSSALKIDRQLNFSCMLTSLFYPLKENPNDVVAQTNSEGNHNYQDKD
jgi:hypothetical protein